MSLKKINKDCTRLHRERHQPESRKHLGYLEKKKDYKQRANDYQFKNKVITRLRKKAFDKNPDEFNFHMINSQMVEGKHFEKRDDDDEFTDEQMSLMLTQDASYIAYKRSVELKKIDKLRASLHLIDVKDRPKNQHLLFLDDKSQVSEFDLAKKMNVHASVLDLDTTMATSVDFLKNHELQSLSKIDLLKAKRDKERAYHQLMKRMKREEQLKIILQKMESKKRLCKERKDAKRVMKGTKNHAPVYKFKQIRKK